jgi:hypothetical protein
MSKLEDNNKEPIFVIGFPKSGNTWLARLLAEATQSNIAVNCSSDTVNAVDNSTERSGRHVIYKKHVVEDEAKVLQCKVVYIVRDVRDVLVSWFFHCNRWATSDNAATSNRFYQWYFSHSVLKSSEKLRGSIWSEFRVKVSRLTKYLVSGKHSRRMIIGNWSDHVAYWREKPVVVVRYEDLLRDTEAEMIRIAAALEIDVSDDIIRECVLNQDFKKKKLEFKRAGDNKNAQFLRQGRAGSWKTLLPPSVIKKIESQHARVMNEVGYELEFFDSIEGR